MAAHVLTCIKADRVLAGWSPSKYFGCGGIGQPQGISHGAASDFALVHIEPILQAVSYTHLTLPTNREV